MFLMRRAPLAAAVAAAAAGAAPRAYAPMAAGAAAALRAAHAQPFTVRQPQQRAAFSASRAARDQTQSEQPVDPAPSPPSDPKQQPHPEVGSREWFNHPEVAQRSVFAGNCPLEATGADVTDYFSQYSPAEAAMPGPTGGYWFLVFSDSEAAKQVIQNADGNFWNGRRLRVTYRTSGRHLRIVDNHRDMEPTETLFIGNMPYNMSDQDLNELSRQLEYCFDIRVAIDRHTGWPRGYCHVDFYTVGLAQRMMKKIVLSNISMAGNSLRVNYAKTSGPGNSLFKVGRMRALRNEGRTLQFYEDLTEELRKQEGDFTIIPPSAQAWTPSRNLPAGEKAGASE